MTLGLVLGLCRNVYCRQSWMLLLLVFNQIFLSYNKYRQPTYIFTIDITCCSLHISPGLKGHDFKAFSCSIDSFFMPIRRYGLVAFYDIRPRDGVGLF